MVFFKSFLSLLRSKDNINICNVRASRLKYMLIFPLAPVFANMQGLYSAIQYAFSVWMP